MNPYLFSTWGSIIDLFFEFMFEFHLAATFQTFVSFHPYKVYHVKLYDLDSHLNADNKN